MSKHKKPDDTFDNFEEYVGHRERADKMYREKKKKQRRPSRDEVFESRWN